MRARTPAPGTAITQKAGAEQQHDPDDSVTVPAPPGDRTDRWAVRARQRHAAVHALLAEGVARDSGSAEGPCAVLPRARAVEELLTRNGTGRQPSLL
jgi:hypothetical protein